MENSTIWLTRDAYDKLAAELEHLKGDGRRIVTAKIAQARDEGDLSENGGYHGAGERQRPQEPRSRQLGAMLEPAQVGEAPTRASTVGPGTLVTIFFDDDPDDEDTFLLGSRELMTLDDAVDLEVYSPQSPLGAAILGAAAGDTVTYAAPNGRPISVTIVDVKAF